MSDIVISIDNLSKVYRIGHQAAVRERQATLSELTAREVRSFARKASDFFHGKDVVQGDAVSEFWALKDVSFEVKRGEVVGIIGRNGAGKTTLLKILSRITQPTSGTVRLNGRVASLLEVGTGFHLDLTGRENIYLNGAILGMSRTTIRRKFDEIVAFAEVEEFLDTPVKRYSSGMHMRLAFSVAAHLEPDILIVDEVLAVGDVEFQQKCLIKMDGSAREGRTVLLVSHDMRKAMALCSRGILLNAGQVEIAGEMPLVAERYLAHRRQSAAFADLEARSDRSGSGDARFRSIQLFKDGLETRTFIFGQAFTQKLVVKVNKRIGSVLMAIDIKTDDGVAVHDLWNVDDECRWAADVGEHNLTVHIDKLMLYPGKYSIDLWLGDKSTSRIDNIVEAITFEVIQDGKSGLARNLDRRGGVAYQKSTWKHTKAGEPQGANTGIDL